MNKLAGTLAAILGVIILIAILVGDPSFDFSTGEE